MNIQTEKIRLAKLILDTENPKIIEAVIKIFKKEITADFWDELSSGQKAEIDKASEEIEKGEFIDYDDFIQKHRQKVTITQFFKRSILHLQSFMLIPDCKGC